MLPQPIAGSFDLHDNGVVRLDLVSFVSRLSEVTMGADRVQL
jgi:hypothetical protein